MVSDLSTSNLDRPIAVVFSLRLGLGGSEVMAVELAKAYCALGYDVLFLYAEGNADISWPKGIVCQRARLFGLGGVAQGDKRGLLSRVALQLVDLYNPLACKQLVNIIHHHLLGRQPQIIHFNKVRGLSPTVFSVLRAHFSAKLLYTAHDYELFSPSAKNSWLNTWWAQGYRRLRFRQVDRLDVIFCPSRYVEDAFKKVFPASAERVNLLENFCLESGGRPENREYSSANGFGFLGRLESIKGVEQICEAFSKEAVGASLTVAGCGSIEANLRQKYMNAGIRFVGPLEGQTKTDFIKGLKFLLVPSIWEEVYGLVVVEALYHGVPVVVSDQGGLPELISSGENGEILAKEIVVSPKALARSLRELAEMPNDRYRQFCHRVIAMPVRISKDYVVDLKNYLEQLPGSGLEHSR